MTHARVFRILAGLLLFGSMESHAINGAAYDFGDAPFSYGTLLADNGPRHGVSQLYLGSQFDSEPDGQPNANALGDNLNNVDDEEGIVFTSPIVAGQSATLDAVATGSGLLSGWVDFNGDGDWSDLDERIFANLALVSGVNTASFAVPLTATPGNSFARFRLASQRDLSVVGAAADGEVEDYRIEVQAALVPEPTTLALVALGLLGLAAIRRKGIVV